MICHVLNDYDLQMYAEKKMHEMVHKTLLFFENNVRKPYFDGTCLDTHLLLPAKQKYMQYRRLH
jgi:hypothetical protein